MKKKTSPAMTSKNSTKNSKANTGQQYRRLSAAVKELKAIERGELAPSRAFVIEPDGKGGFIRKQVTPTKRSVTTPGAALAIAARSKIGLSQTDFAALIGVAPGTLRGWEQGRREPNRAARVLLAVAASEPEAVLKAAKAA